VPSPSLGCHDDDLDARQLVVARAAHALDGVDTSQISCGWLHARVPLCDPNTTLFGHPLRDIATTFCPGTCANYCTAPFNRSVLAPSLFDEMHAFRDVLENELHIDPSQIRDITTLPTNRTARITTDDALALLSSATPLADAYRAQLAHYTNYDQTATLMEVLLPDGPAGSNGLDALYAMRAAVQRPRFAPFEFVVQTDISTVLDYIALVMRQAPRVLSLTTCGGALVVGGLAFRSLLVPLRLLLTIVVTLVLVAALSAWVYQDVIPIGGLYWIVPISCSTLMIGLSLDYDVFLISEIYELRVAGYTTEAAILRAMGTESSTITTAGLIMTIAFSSMLLSSTDVLNQWGLLLVSTSLIDTFLVRTLLVPSLMFYAVEWNWWPGRMPPPKCLTHLEEPMLQPCTAGAGGPLNHGGAIRACDRARGGGTATDRF